MLSADDFFELLAQKKDALNANPFLDVNDQNGLEGSYCLLRNIHKPTSQRRPRQTRSRHSKAKQSLRNAWSIAKSLFVLVAVTVSITDLASIEHNQLFPRLEQWWKNNPVSQEFEEKAHGLLQELDDEREQGNLHRNQTIPPASLSIQVLNLFLETRTRTQGKSKKVPDPSGQTAQRTVRSAELTEHTNLLSHHSEAPTLSSQLVFI
jgi:hypothetical protein